MSLLSFRRLLISYYDISVCLVWGKIMTLSVLFICFVYSQHKPVWTITTMMKMRPRPLFPKRREMIFLCRNTSYTPCYTMLHTLPCNTCYTMLHTILHILHNVTYVLQRHTMSHHVTHVTHVAHMLHTMLHNQFRTTMAMILLRGNFNGNPIEGARFSSKTVTASRKTFYI